MRRIIKWQSQHLEINTVTGKLEDSDIDEYYEEEYEDDYGDGAQRAPVQNVMSTPFGFWRVDDSMNPFKQFKMWMAHTNFTITPEVVELIKSVPGVEVLQVMTRYRFIMGVGELFDIHDVRVTIEDELECNKDESDMIPDERLLQKVFELRQQLAPFDQWAIYVFPNGEIDFATSEQEDFGKQLNIFKQAVDHSNGILIESDNE